MSPLCTCFKNNELHIIPAVFWSWNKILFHLFVVQQLLHYPASLCTILNTFEHVFLTKILFARSTLSYTFAPPPPLYLFMQEALLHFGGACKTWEMDEHLVQPLLLMDWTRLRTSKHMWQTHTASTHRKQAQGANTGSEHTYQTYTVNTHSEHTQHSKG